MGYYVNKCSIIETFFPICLIYFLSFFNLTLWCWALHDRVMLGRRKRAEREGKIGVYISVSSVWVYVPTSHGLYLMPWETFYQDKRAPASAGYDRAYTTFQALMLIQITFYQTSKKPPNFGMFKLLHYFWVSFSTIKHSKPLGSIICLIL